MSTTTLSLPDWIQRARAHLPQKDYLECAITVASELTHHLIDVVNVNDPDGRFNGSLSSIDGDCMHSSSSPLLILIGDIAPRNVRVTVESARNSTHEPSSPLAKFRASDVKIHPDADASFSDLNNIFAVPQLSQQDVCFALGKIFLELFSEGASSLLSEFDLQKNETSIGDLQMGDINTNENGNYPELVDDEDDDDDDFDVTVSALKKAFLSPIDLTDSPTKSMKANKYLREHKLPLSICRLVSDLLDAEKGNAYIPDVALLSLEEVKHDLMHMNLYPERFLHDTLCPIQALDKTCLFSHADDKLYGRENELSILMGMVKRISSSDPPLQRKERLCEAAFLGGHSGSGKSSIIKQLVSHWNPRGWPVVFCKFDRQFSPLSALILAFDAFFGKSVPNQVDGIIPERRHPMQHTVDRISGSIVTSTDNESFHQLCELLPSFGRLFPMAMQNLKQKQIFRRENSPGFIDYTSQTASASSPGNVGSGGHRLLNLFHILFKAISGAGHPVLICIEDLQWADEVTTDIIVQSVRSISELPKEGHAGGILLLGSFRDNEVPEEGFLMNNIKLLQQNANVNMLSIGELPLQDVDDMLTFKFCLPKRYIRDLAQLVYQKTRGNPIYVTEFLRSIIQKKLMAFSVKSHRWTWDDTAIDLQMISGGVVGLLTKKLKQLPSDVIEALKVISCLGQANISTIELLDLGEFVPNMFEALESAIKEGIVERAGPVFAFCHDMLQESTYNLIPPDKRKPLHKMIGMNLVIQDPQNANNPELCTLAVDQINICKDVDGILNHAERAFVASLNLTAGKHSMSTKKSNFQQAGGYFETGISLLYADNWTKQYKLSLELYERSVAVSFMDGKIKTVPKRVDEIISNARSFSDTLNARALLAKFLASQERYADATNEVLEILSCLGESFPKEITTSLIMNEINEITPMLEGMTKAKMLNLSTMTDIIKLQAMKFMDLLTSLSIYSSPMLMHLVPFRMTKLTFSFGFNDQYSVPGLVFMSQALLQYSNNNIWLATQLTRTAECLIKDNPNSHALRGRLALIIGSVQCFVEPLQSAVAKLMDGYNSATIAGDVDNAMVCGLFYSGGMLFCTADLMEDQRKFRKLLHKMVERKRIGLLHSSMSYFDSYSALIGKEHSCDINAGIEMKTNKELIQIAEQTQNSYLMHQVTLNLMYVHCYYREYLQCANLAENYHTTQRAKRAFDFYLLFLRGISALNLARDTKEAKWRKIGEGAVKSMNQLVHYSSWNFENKHLLLQAELHYLNGRHSIAELAYQSSIISAHNHKFIHEEALACELYGVFLINNKEAEKGMKQLQHAHTKYRQWGALKKAKAVEYFMDLV